MKNIKETRYYFIKEIDQNELMSKKHKNIYATLNYIEHSFIIASPVTGCISTSAFSFLLGISIGILSSAVGICAITAAIKKVYVNN